MFRPTIPLSGLPGWSFLQSTYDRQLASFSSSAQLRNDQAYLDRKLSQPITVDSFLDDRRLLRTALTAFGLEGESWKRGFIKKVLTEAADPGSTFLARLNNPQYSKFAEVFRPVAGTIRLTEANRTSIRETFVAESFETAVGQVDNGMRLALNFKSEIASLVGNGSSDQAILFRLLGNVPARTVLEGALGLPESLRTLPIERQADILSEQLSRKFGIRELNQLRAPANADRIIERFITLQSAGSLGSSAPGASLLTLFTGASASSAENLFRSRFG
jgi:Protein of unknown function (DUF1217)